MRRRPGRPRQSKRWFGAGLAMRDGLVGEGHSGERGREGRDPQREWRGQRGYEWRGASFGWLGHNPPL